MTRPAWDNEVQTDLRSIADRLERLEMYKRMYDVELGQRVALYRDIKSIEHEVSRLTKENEELKARLK